MFFRPEKSSSFCNFTFYNCQYLLSVIVFLTNLKIYVRENKSYISKVTTQNEIIKNFLFAQKQNIRIKNVYKIQHRNKKRRNWKKKQ